MSKRGEIYFLSLAKKRFTIYLYMCLGAKIGQKKVSGPVAGAPGACAQIAQHEHWELNSLLCKSRNCSLTFAPSFFIRYFVFNIC